MHKLEISGAITNILEIVELYLTEDSLMYNFYGKIKACSAKKYVCRACRLYVQDKGSTLFLYRIPLLYNQYFSKRKGKNVKMLF